ncbi:MAG: translation elongation factor Ts [bacterium]|nr:translation elongation factor Ts [bacterium]
MSLIEQIKELREATGISLAQCKKALEQSRGDIEKARGLLREWGVSVAAKKEGREAGEGIIHAYVHQTGKVGVLVDVRCETDFVTRSEDFHALCHEVALQIAAMNPQDTQELLSQPYIKESSRTVKDLLTDTIAKVGENITVYRFSRFEV